jgi:type II secretory pathway pseudopilin PulG
VCACGRPGITLLEAAFALVVVGLAAVAVLTAVGAELRTAEQAQRGLEAAALAEHRLARIRPLPHHELRALSDSLARGRFEPPFERYRWEATVRPVRGEPDLMDVVVRIDWESGRYDVRTRAFRPAPGTVRP